MHSNKLLHWYVLGKIMNNLSLVTYIWNFITAKPSVYVTENWPLKTVTDLPNKNLF